MLGPLIDRLPKGFYYVCLCMITTVYTICALRTNLVLFSALLLLVVTFGLFAGSYFENALGNTDLGGSLGKVSQHSSKRRCTFANRERTRSPAVLF